MHRNSLIPVTSVTCTHLSPWRPWSGRGRASPACSWLRSPVPRRRDDAVGPAVAHVHRCPQSHRHTGECVQECGCAMAGLTPPGNRGSCSSTEKLKAHTQRDTFQVVKTKTGHIRQRKCSDGKAYTRLLHLWPKHKLLLRWSLGSLENLNFQHIFRRLRSISTLSG